MQSLCGFSHGLFLVPRQRAEAVAAEQIAEDRALDRNEPVVHPLEGNPTKEDGVRHIAGEDILADDDQRQDEQHLEGGVVALPEELGQEAGDFFRSLFVRLGAQADNDEQRHIEQRAPKHGVHRGDGVIHEQADQNGNQARYGTDNGAFLGSAFPEHRAEDCGRHLEEARGGEAVGVINQKGRTERDNQDNRDHQDDQPGVQALFIGLLRSILKDILLDDRGDHNDLRVRRGQAEGKYADNQKHAEDSRRILQRHHRDDAVSNRAFQIGVSRAAQPDALEQEHAEQHADQQRLRNRLQLEHFRAAAHIGADHDMRPDDQAGAGGQGKAEVGEPAAIRTRMRQIIRVFRQHRLGRLDQAVAAAQDCIGHKQGRNNDNADADKTGERIRGDNRVGAAAHYVAENIDDQDDNNQPEGQVAACCNIHAVRHADDLRSNIGDHEDDTDTGKEQREEAGFIPVRNHGDGGHIIIFFAEQPHGVHQAGRHDAHEERAGCAGEISHAGTVGRRRPAVKGQCAPDGQAQGAQQHDRAYRTAGDKEF